MSVVHRIRKRAGLTQSELARVAGTSQPAIASYESGAKVPSLRTLRRLAASVGLDLDIRVVPALTREDRRSIHLHHAIADRLIKDPEPVLARARANLSRMRDLHPAAGGVFDEWERILSAPKELIASTLVDPGPAYRELRQVTPFAGVLTAAERADAYAQFRREEALK